MMGSGYDKIYDEAWYNENPCAELWKKYENKSHKIPPKFWKEGIAPNDGGSYTTYQSPLGYSYYRHNSSISVWASGERQASVAVGSSIHDLTRNELLQLKLEIDKVYKEIDT